MGMFQYNFKDLAKFFEDVRYLNKYEGGGDANEPSFLQTLLILQPPAPPNGHPSMLVIVIFAILNIIVYAFIFVVLYAIYYILFKGYPKFLPDLLTFHMSNVVDLDKFISRNNGIFDAYKVLLDKDHQCDSGYVIYSEIYGNISLKDNMKDLDALIQTIYKQYKYDEKYERAFREYYYFYYKIYDEGGPVTDTSKTNPDSLNRLVDTSDNAADKTVPITVNGVEKPLQHYQYYDALRKYLIYHKEYDTSQTTGSGEQSSETQLWNIYSKDKMIKYKQHSYLKTKMIKVAQDLQKANDQVNNPATNILPYLVLPSSLDDIKKVSRDFKKFQSSILDGSVYLPSDDPKYIPFERMNEYTWYIIEIINYQKKGAMFNKMFAQPNSKMTYFMNLPVQKRKEANEKLKLGLSAQTIEYINKLPILSHIYFNPNISDKQKFYGKVMNAYKSIMTINCSNIVNGATEIDSQMINLDMIGGNFKKLVNAINIAHLYYNVYAHDLIKLYEKKYRNDDDFLKELWMPFAKDMVFNRVLVGFVKYWKDSWIGPPFPTKNYLEFSQKYKFIEDTMTGVVKNTWARLFTSSDPGKPQEAESM
jgi:hypothetical protein